MHQPHLSLAFLHSHDFDELVPTLKLLLALLPALVALAYGVVRPKPQTPPRKAGALDKWRSALASLAVVLLVARSVVGKGQVAALTAAGAAGVLGLLANEEAVLGLSEAWPTRLAWLCVAGAAGWDLARSHSTLDSGSQQLPSR